MLPSRQQLPAIALLLLLLTAFVAASAVLRQFVERETAANIEAAVIVGAFTAAVVVGFLRKGR